MELAAVSLQDKYLQSHGRIFISGLQALVRLPVMQAQRDRAAGLNSGGFISGYRGSPLGQYDLALTREADMLARHGIHFTPAINEDLGATAVWGTQQVGLHGPAKVDGVFAIWYGKGPGVDRSMDAIKHGNYAGAARLGGVLLVCGDDHNAQSSSLPHQSEQMLQGAMIPILNPANVQEYLDYGLLGIALSRFSGCWVGFKAISDTVESAATIDVDPDRLQIVVPADFAPPSQDIHIRASDTPLAQEARVMGPRMEAVQAFARANRLDRTVIAAPQARLGIITTGKAYLDVLQALEELGLDEAGSGQVAVYKVGMSWPLEPEGVRAFALGLDDILVVEEKRAFVEDQVVKALYNLPGKRPTVVGKSDEQGQGLLPSQGELDAQAVGNAIASRLRKLHGDTQTFATPARTRAPRKVVPIRSTRIQYFCSGCPHNTSTKVPEGSRAMAGVGCHGMVTRMQRNTSSFTHMGAEGVNWVGQSPFTEEKHVFQNLGDGTYFHSGILAIRQAVASNVNITYKLLFNSAVAMTGGQPLEGTLTVPQLAHQLVGEGVGRVVVVTDDTGKYSAMAAMPKGVAIHHRDAMDELQRGLREVPGVTALIFDQTCAAEKRRLRKKGKMVEPPKRVFINDEVCEACGDCSVQSNCVSVKPLETELGRKRQIDQSNCNKDYTCVSGFCPSFVTVSHAQPRKKQPVGGIPQDLIDRLPAPQAAPLQGTYNLLVTGIGGTGVLTIGALLGMAAHLEGKASSVLDFNGVAQKNGAVMSHVRLASDPDALTSTRLATGSADLLLGCDLVVSASPSAISRFSSERTHAVVNAHNTPTAAFILDGNVDFESEALREALEATVAQSHFVDATRIAEALLGDSIGANLFLVGFALQKGLLPLSAQAIERAIELNGVSVAMNQQALAWGRLAAHDPDALQRAIAAPQPVTPAQHMAFEDMLAHYAQRLQRYQNGAYAQAFTHFIRHVQAQENARIPGSDILTRTTATSLHKLMCYKDEYEVARLYTDGSFMKKLTERFEGAPTLQFHLAPPLWSRFNAKGEARKRAYGPWAFQAFRLLARMKGLRGTVLDPFGHTRERRSERALIGEFREKVDGLLALLDVDNLATAVEIAEVPQSIRGFGHVRERHLLEARQRWAALDAQWRAPRTTLRQAA